MKHEIAINRGLAKRNPLLWPRDIDNYESRETFAPTATPECEAYALGCDARNDFKAIDENPYAHGCDDHQDWAQGWADADRALDEDYDRKLD